MRLRPAIPVKHLTNERVGELLTDDIAEWAMRYGLEQCKNPEQARYVDYLDEVIAEAAERLRSTSARTNEPAPCPFCGSWHSKVNVVANSCSEYWWECNECGATGPYADDTREAYAKWQQRARWTPVEYPSRHPIQIAPSATAKVWTWIRTGFSIFR